MNEKNHEKIPPQKISDLGYYFLNVLQAKAWQYLGLLVHPENGETLVDLKEAHRAIDLFELIFENLKNDFAPSIKKEMEMHLTNLQLNYVEKVKKEGEQSEKK
ncbi:DUF1844 domain-containing protein [Atribacter laminatus]|jgi:hypothetical protein|uniref:DUF1844 domain-containing protein n=1 Tax=Atribacter laminatus TaxID=2847778 RepID=A0A7T1F3M8_ATRLM|nr:DUF1844 domain-containing protein [Atribacter laminatus]QPM69278.1 hypothetical protein RT761_02508 [Atribacter laminatus]